MKKRIAGILLSCGVIFGVTACGNHTEEVTLHYAFNGTGNAASEYEEIFDKFEEENPGINVELVFIPSTDWPDFIAKMQTMIAGGTEIDACHLTNESMPVFYDLDMLECMDSYMEEHPEWFSYRDDIVDMCQMTYEREGKTYGIAKDWNTVVAQFNKEMLDEAGLTLPDENWGKEEFLQYCEKLTVKNEDGSTRYALTIPLYYFGYNAWFMANGGKMFNDDFSECTINSPQIVEIVQLWQDLIYQYGYAGIPQASDDAVTMLMNEQTAMQFSGMWSLASYIANDWKNTIVQTLPKFNADDWHPINGVGGSGVLKSSKHIEEAMKLAAFTGDDYYIQNVSVANGYVPARESLMEDVVNGFDYIENKQLFYTTAADSYPAECTPTYGSDGEIITRYLMECLSSADADIQAILDQCAEEVTAVRQKNMKK